MTAAVAPDALLPYQQRALKAISLEQVLVVEKSRRIGLTWGIAADAVLTAGAAKAAGGSDVWYIGYNLEMAREFIDACAMWARSFALAAGALDEFLFVEEGDDGADRAIKAFRIKFASGFEVVALCSAPRSLRGKQGKVVIDEAAFHPALGELLKAAMALLMWGGKVIVISTHDGVDNEFNRLVEDCRSGRKPYGLMRITFDDAVADGLYRRICLVAGRAWSADGEAQWVREIRENYGDDAAEELDCIPAKSGGRFLAMSLLLARATSVPVVRWQCDDAFALRSDEQRAADCAAFCREQLRPLLATLPREGVSSFVGEDFGRSGDLSVDWPLLMQSGKLSTPFVLELRNVPFVQQEQIFYYLCDGLPNFCGAALDGRGNGQFLAERAVQKYGPCCEAVMLSVGWYREQMPPLKAALEDATVDIPNNEDLLGDLRSLEVVGGVARVPEKARKTKAGQRHGDGAIALALAHYAARLLDFGPLDASVGAPMTTASEDVYAGRSLGHRKPGGWDL